MQNSTKKSHHNQTKPLRNLQVIATVGVAFVFALTSLIVPVEKTQAQNQSATTTATTTEEISTTTESEPMTASRREELEQRLEEINLQIKEQENAISNLRSEEQTIENRLGQLRAEVNSINLQIEAVELNLQKLNQDIYETQRTINRTQNQIENHKEALSDSLQKVYETDKQSLIAILLKNDQISDFFDSINNILLVQNNIQNSLNEVTNLRQELIQEKEDLSTEKKEVENLKTIRENQRQQLTAAENEQERLLSLTVQERRQEEEVLKEQRKTASEIRSQIFKLVGGGELTFEKAYDLAKLAEDATGVRAALIMAILQRETNTGSRDAKQFLGGCNYEEAMHPDRDIPVFMAITDNLGINPDSTVAQVSCPIPEHGYYGGAMGPSQFIPSTWAIYGGYEKVSGEWQYNRSEDRVRQATGKNSPSNPWNNADAFTATALYIKDLYESNTCSSYANGLDHKYPRQELQEECASARYYAGSNWRDYYTWYGIDVVEQANSIQQDIDIIN